MSKHILLVLCFFLLVAIMSVTFTNTAIKYTSTTEFCIGCHEMRTTVYKEYQNTLHFKNGSGVRATCSDCHVPHEWYLTLYRKVLAVKDVYHHWLGTIDTAEKFEAQRLKMAETVWKSMKNSNSKECRNCHNFEAMDYENQRRRAAKQHQNAVRNEETCIDCHKGIAHKKPESKEEKQSNDEEIIF